MARLKITETPTEATGYKIPSFGSLALPLELATQQASGLANVGKAVKEIYKDQKEKEDNATFIGIVSEVSPKLSEIYNQASKDTNVLNGTNFYKDAIKNEDFLSKYPNANREVKDKFNSWLQKHQLESFPKLSTKITSNHIENLKVKYDEYLTNLNMKRSSVTDAGDVRFGDDEFDRFIKSKEYTSIFTPEQLKKEVERYTEQALSFRNSHNHILDPNININNKQKIVELFGTERAEKIIDRARAKIISDGNIKLNKDLFEARANTQKQNDTFAELILRINNSNQNPDDLNALNNKPSLDFIRDLEAKGSINSVQSSRLFQSFTSKEILSDAQLLTELSAQIAVANTVDKVDTLRKTVNADITVMQKLGLKDLDTVNKILNSSKKDREGFREYQNYLKILQANMDAIPGFVLFKDQETGTKVSRSVQAVERYTKFVYEQNLTPEEAYLRTISTEEKNLPKLKEISLSNDLKKRTEVFTDVNYKDGINTYRSELAEKHRTGKINTNDLKEELKQISFLEDVADIHKKFEKSLFRQQTQSVPDNQSKGKTNKSLGNK